MKNVPSVRLEEEVKLSKQLTGFASVSMLSCSSKIANCISPGLKLAFVGFCSSLLVKAKSFGQTVSTTQLLQGIGCKSVPIY